MDRMDHSVIIIAVRYVFIREERKQKNRVKQMDAERFFGLIISLTLGKNSSSFFVKII